MSNKDKGPALTDVREDGLSALPPKVLQTLLRDHTTGKNIFWATQDYEALGPAYDYHSEIRSEQITGDHEMVVMPRVQKSRQNQTDRSKDMAEVFTPSWICNAQNNLVDEAWFGRKDVFNIENTTDHTWQSTSDKIEFPEGKTWKDYVRSTRMEITCGEAPYLVSRYDTTTGETIPLSERIGLLDRKIHLINQHVEIHDDWLHWVQTAYQNTYGYEWQGDSLLLARINLLATFMDYHNDRFGEPPAELWLQGIAEIISWNLWQMDGLKGVVPDSCKDNITEKVATLFGEEELVLSCPGCRQDDITLHNGIYCVIRDWSTGKIIRYVDLLR